MSTTTQTKETTVTPKTRHNIKNGFYLALFLGSVLGFTFWFMALAANAAGSDAETPYTVGLHGIQLPAGDTFPAHGHVNLRMTDGSTAGIHFDPNNGHPGGQWIGKSYIPYEAFGLKSTKACVEWVQISHYNEHYGEGGQPPVGKACKTTPPPKPEKPEPLTGEKVTGVYECVDPANGTGIATITTTAWTQDYKWKSGAWVLGKKVYSEPVVTTEISDDVACIPESPLPKSGTASDSHDFCTEPADGTRTYATTETAWIADPVWSQDAGEWTYGDKVYGEPSETTEVIEDETCAAPVTEITPKPSPEPSVTPAPDVMPDTPATSETPTDSTPVLAETGADTSTPLMIAAALGLVGAGVAIVRKRWTA